MTIPINSIRKKALLTGASFGVVATLLAAAPASAIVPGRGQTSESIVDNEGGVNGIGMFFRADGSVCSGSLINPRTVLFASHCVNDVSEANWGAATGGLAAAFSFNVDALPGFQSWFANNFMSNAELNVFNINEIQFNPASIARPIAQGFLEADIALATLDTPAANIPTWALLFSALPVPASIDPVTGTGYHVNITGYGRTGSGTNGDDLGIDFRRRLAENYIGALASLDERNAFLFGPGGAGNLPQNLYQIDFDDANRTNTQDFNLFRDEALPNEGTTAGGDSGSPLILDAANNDLYTQDLVLGVLSGGSRFFADQADSSFGTSSFYQPLYLYADYIAAANPYNYVSALSGDGDWEDASHWQTDLDPAYKIIDANGDVVNGFPDEVSAGVNGTEPDFGQACFNTQICQDLNTGEFFVPQASPETTPETPPETPPEATPETGNQTSGATNTNSVGYVNLSDSISDGTASVSGNTQSALGRVQFSIDTAQATGIPLPAPTLENGLAGATDFVPNNVTPDPSIGLRARYFDVTLSADGTTTLSSAVTIDRLTIAGAQAGLNITNTGSLTSLIDIELVNGFANIDGDLTSRGDFLLMSGLLTGSGTITTPFLTSVFGTIAPGGIGTIGTLTIDGSAVFASASQLLIDLGANGVSDLLAISGDVSLGGTVSFNPTTQVRAGNTYTFLTNGGTQSLVFDAAQLSAILRPVLTYNSNSVEVTILASSFVGIVNHDNPVQISFAQLLDGNRPLAANFDSLYGPLDLANANTIRATFNDWAPTTETTAQNLAKASLSSLSRFHHNRLRNLGNGRQNGGTVSIIGQPVQLASAASLSNPSGRNTIITDADTQTQIHNSASVPDNVAVYLAGAYIDGSSTAAPGAPGLRNDQFNGWYIAGGAERFVSDSFTIGASLSYTALDATTQSGRTADNQLIAASVYARKTLSDNVFLDGLVSLGNYNTKTTRNITLPTNYTLLSDENNLVWSAEFGLSKHYKTKDFILAPGIGIRQQSVDFGTTDESGGGPALSIERNKYNSTQGRLGLDIISHAKSKFLTNFNVNYIHEIANAPNNFNANFVGGVDGVLAPFALARGDRDWVEIGGSVGYNFGRTIFSVSVDSTLGRSDVETQTYQANISVKF